MKIGLLIELIGENATGKTHASLLSPEPFMCDLTPKGEARAVVMKLFEDWADRYRRCRSLAEIRDCVECAIGGGFKTIIFDSSDYLQDFAIAEYLEEKQKERVFPITQYAIVRGKVDKIIYDISNVPLNLILTSAMKDQYIKDTKTGKRERDGYKKLDFMSDIRIYISLHKDDGGNWVRSAKVVKNRFQDRCGENYVEELCPLDFDSIVDAAGLPEEVVVR